MYLARLIIEIEKIRRKLYQISNENPQDMLKTSQELDILINEYFKIQKVRPHYTTSN